MIVLIIASVILAIPRVARALDELDAIQTYDTWKDMSKIERRLEELTKIFELEGQKGEENE